MLLFFLKRSAIIIICIEKKIDSLQNVPWYCNKVGSKHKKIVSQKHTSLLNITDAVFNRNTTARK